MQLFVDTSDPDIIKDFIQRGIAQGVTTNPTTASEYLRSHPGSMKKLAFKLADIADGNPISIEAVGCAGPYRSENITAKRLYDEASEIIKWNRELGYPAFWQKIPTIRQGVEAIHKLVKDHGDGALINATLGFDFKQGFRAAMAGAHVFSLFMGRMETANPALNFSGEDSVSVAKEIISRYNSDNIATGFLAASMRTPELIIRSWDAGSDIATAPPAVLEQLAEKFPVEFKRMLVQHPRKRTRKMNEMLHMGANEFAHSLLKPGLDRFVADAASANYDLLE